MLLLLRFFTFFYVFFENPKKRDFLRFFALLHTFSRTMAACVTMFDKQGSSTIYCKKKTTK